MARGTVQGEVVVRRWLVGRVRVAGVLARHAALIDGRLADKAFKSDTERAERPICGRASEPASA